LRGEIEKKNPENLQVFKAHTQKKKPPKKHSLGGPPPPPSKKKIIVEAYSPSDAVAQVLGKESHW